MLSRGKTKTIYHLHYLRLANIISPYKLAGRDNILLRLDLGCFMNLSVHFAENSNWIVAADNWGKDKTLWLRKEGMDNGWISSD